MTTPRRRGPPNHEMTKACAEAKAMRAEAYAYKAKRVRSMYADGVSKSDIASCLGVSGGWIQKVLNSVKP